MRFLLVDFYRHGASANFHNPVALIRARWRVTLHFGRSHAPASEPLEGQDIAVNLGVHSHFFEIGLDPYQYHLWFTSFCTMYLREDIWPLQ